MSAVLEGRLVDDDLSSFRLDTLHDALDGTLAEVVRVGLHGQTIYADDAFLLLGAVPLAVAAVVACLCKYLVCNEILSGAVRIDDGLDKVLGNVIVVGEKLLGVLRKAISAVAE